TIATEKLPQFEESLEEVMQEQAESHWKRSLTLDSAILLETIDDALLKELETLRPFGPGNPEPLFLCTGAELKNPRIVGEKHLRCTVAAGGKELAGIAFNTELPRGIEEKKWDLACIPQWNTYLNQTTIQLKIRETRVTAAVLPSTPVLES
ncbi:MAG: hypothetical protein Q7S68_02155, partial [Deltaproteobacteria bacterium]|nr:hypothetical protein [Deltaproteobacteria bacterium]